MRGYALQDLVSFIPSSHHDNVKFVLLLVIILPSHSLLFLIAKGKYSVMAKTPGVGEHLCVMR